MYVQHLKCPFQNNTKLFLGGGGGGGGWERGKSFSMCEYLIQFINWDVFAKIKKVMLHVSGFMN